MQWWSVPPPVTVYYCHILLRCSIYGVIWCMDLASVWSSFFYVLPAQLVIMRAVRIITKLTIISINCSRFINSKKAQWVTAKAPMNNKLAFHSYSGVCWFGWNKSILNMWSVNNILFANSFPICTNTQSRFCIRFLCCLLFFWCITLNRFVNSYRRNVSWKTTIDRDKSVISKLKRQNSTELRQPNRWKRKLIQWEERGGGGGDKYIFLILCRFPFTFYICLLC